MSNKRLAELLVGQFEKNPRWALLLAPVGVWIAYSGISDALANLSLKNKPTQFIQVDRVFQGPNHRGFTVDFVAGKTTDGEAIFYVSKKRARQINVGERMGIVETGDPNFPYKIRSDLDEQLSDIHFSIGSLPFNAMAILGSVLALGGIGWALFGKPKIAAPTDEKKEELSTAGS